MVDRFTLTVDGTDHSIIIEGNSIWVDGDRYFVRKDGTTIEVDGVRYDVDLQDETATVNGDTYSITADVSPQLSDTSEASVEASEASSGGHVKAIMPGRVIAIRAQEGDNVEQGDVIIVLEAMKMENELKAHMSGTVKEMRAFVGKNVEVNETLAVIE
jgi:biotin carboxyl carrier protein